jgi:hypothetical protein
MTVDQKALLLMQIDLMKELDEDISPEKRLILLDKLKATVESFTPKLRATRGAGRMHDAEPQVEVAH